MQTEPDDDVLSGKSRIVSNVITSWFSYLVFFAAGFVLPHLIDRELGQAMLGIWDFSWSLVNYLSLSALGIGSSLNRYVARYRAAGDDESLQIATSTVVVIQSVLGFLLLGLAALIAAFLPASLVEGDGVPIETLSSVFFLLGASLAVQFLFDTSRGVLQGCHRWDLFNAINAGTYFLAVIAMITLLYSGYGLIEMAIVYLVMNVAQGIIRLLIARSICPASKFRMSAVSKDFGKEIVVFGGKSILINIAPTVVIQTTFVVVMSTLGPAALAVLARSVALIRHIETFFTRFTFIVTPMAGSIDVLQSTEGVRAFALDSVKFAYALSLPVIIVFCLYGPAIIEIWMGADYVNTTLIAILGLGYLLPMSQSPMVNVLIGIDQHGRAALISTVATVTVYLTVLVVVFAADIPMKHVLLIAVPLTLVQGVALPIYACLQIGLPLKHYFTQVFVRTTTLNLVIATPLIAGLYYFDLSLLDSLLALIVYGTVLAVCYWKWLLPPQLRQILIQPIRKFVISVMHLSAVNHLLLRTQRNRVPVLTLHGVGDPAPNDEWSPTWERCRTQELDRTLSVLTKHYTFITLDEALDMLKGEIPLKPNSMVLTFDDGYLNNITEGLPILKRHNIPFNFFVTTGMMKEQQPFWVDRIDYALQQLDEEQYTLRSPIVESTINLYSNSEAGRTYKEFRKATRNSYADDYQLIHDMEELAETLEKSSGRALSELNKREKWSGVVNEADLQNLPENAVVGSHTVNHIRVDHITQEKLRTELIDSKSYLEQITGSPCRHFCYPQGYYDTETARIADECGYESAYTGEPGTNGVGDDLFKLKRIAFPRGETEAEILYHMLRGFLDRGR
ncbi:MAG: peptidoglycan/xylan/chitin deacetylase (PgdA/CDA1 family)/O-antigen [Candidatus Azotimanducaceae bacterium]|jgi:peptidoglycan/xylan/chitin deacetylase (PgdA/CDA1 family)/O-antigen/teichoic acid export membrane protein